jgi:uncharacterized alpha-E superfamily protein
MPGALTRVAQYDGDVVSMQWGGSSKDTWMLADRPLARVSLRRPRLGPDDVVRSVAFIPSRVGENLYWMGRYTERCEGIARLLRAALVRLADADPESEPALRSLASVSGQLKILPKSDEIEARDFIAAVVDPQVQGGLAANVLRLHACANHVRERMSTDNWHLFHRLQQRLPGPDVSLGYALESLDDIMMTCVSLAGFALDDMTRDESWQFLLLGRRLERLAHVSGIVAHVLASPAAERSDALEWLLEATNSIVTFRALYRRTPELLPVLHLVVLDDTNPHAVAFQMRELALGQELDLGLQGLAPLGEALRNTPLGGFQLEAGQVLEASCAELASLLVRIERVAFGLSDELQRRFFTHAGTPVPVGIEGNEAQ